MPDADLQSGGPTLHSDHDHHGRPQGYVARMGLSLLLRDLGTAGAVLSDVVSAGGDASRVQGVALGMSDPAPLAAAARTVRWLLR